MKSATLGMMLVIASCVSPKEKGDVELRQDSSVCVYKVEIDTLFAGTISGSCVAFKIEEVDLGYKLYLLTAKHVVEAANRICPGFICYNKKSRYQDYGTPANVVRIPFNVEHIDASLDIATISCIIVNKVPVAEIDTTDLTEYTEVYTLGFPYGNGLHSTDGRTTFFQEEGKMWVTNAPVAHGCSGGGVFDRKTNKLIGIISEVGAVRIPDVGSNIPPIHYIWHIHKFVPLNAVKEFLDGK